MEASQVYVPESFSARLAMAREDESDLTSVPWMNQLNEGSGRPRSEQGIEDDNNDVSLVYDK